MFQSNAIILIDDQIISSLASRSLFNLVSGSFWHDCPSITCWKDCSFHTEWFKYPCWKSADHRHKGLSGLIIPFHQSTCLSLGQYHSLNYCDSVVNFEIASVILPTFFCFLKIVLAILGLLHLHMDFRIN